MPVTLPSGVGDHSQLSGVTANQHHNQAHTLDGADHTVSGLTTGHYLKATGATTFAFAALPTAVGVLVYHSTTQSINDDTDATLTFDSETYDTDAFHSGGAATRLTVPSGKDGTYQATYAITFAADADGYRQVTLLKNGSPVAGFDHRLPATPTLATAVSGAFPPIQLVATDYLELRVHHTAGAATNVATNSAFGMMMVQGSVAAVSGTAPDSADYLVETANGSLSAEVVTGTTYMTTAAYASRQAAAKSGRLFLPTNGFALWRDSGSAWIPWGPLFPLTEPPAVSGLTWDNQSTASGTDDKGTLSLAVASASNGNPNVLYKTAPATPWSLVCLMEINAPYMAGANDIGEMTLAFRQSSDGKLVLFGFGSQSNVTFVRVRKWTTTSSFSAEYSGAIAVADNWVLAQRRHWMKIADNGTNRICSFSADGVNFTPFHTIGRTDFLTADQMGVGIQAGNSQINVYVRVYSWAEGS